MIISPSVLFLFYYLSESTQKLVIFNDEGILHVCSVKLCLIIIYATDEKMCFHVQGRKVVDMNDSLLSVLIFVFLFMSAHVGDEGFGQYIKNGINIETFWLRISG